MQVNTTGSICGRSTVVSGNPVTLEHISSLECHESRSHRHSVSFTGGIHGLLISVSTHGTRNTMMDQWSSDAKPDRGYNNDDTESASDGRMMIHKTKRGRWQKVEFTVTEKRRILELGRMELKEEFEKLQAETLDSLPDSYKLMFGRIGFARCDGRNVILPVLILNPYDAPRNVRSSWVGAFNSVSVCAWHAER